MSVLNFSEIEQSAAEVQRFKYWKFGSRPPSSVWSKGIITNLRPSRTHSALACQISIQSGNAQLTYWWLSQFSLPILAGEFTSATPRGGGPNCTKFGTDIGQSSAHLTSYFDVYTLIRSETRAAQRWVGPKMETKFHTFWPAVVNLGFEDSWQKDIRTQMRERASRTGGICPKGRVS